jgi:outer membrane cobalamin receptor
LNAGMIYNITPAISLNVRVHNILSKKYDIWYGHPAQTINILGGFAFQF